MPQHTAKMGAVLGALTLIVTAIAVPARPAGADSEWRPGKFMTQAVARVMASTRKVTEKTEFGLDDGSSCFIGGYVKEEGVLGSSIPLEEGRTYAFLGGGDDDVKDLDLYLMDADGNVVAKDTETDASPVVVFKCKSAGKYRVQMKLVTDKTDASFCVYATLRDGGFDVPTSNLASAYDKLIKFCTIIDDKTKGASFLDEAGELCLVGTILKQGETLTQSGIDLGDGDRAFLACADSRAQDIDLKVVSSDGDVLREDTDNDANPVLFYGGGGTIGLKISDPKSDGATLAMAAVLKVKR